MTTAQLAAAILASLKQKGWSQGRSFADDGTVCLMGAGVLAYTSWPDIELVLEKVIASGAH